MAKNKIYLDHAASTPMDERVLEAMIPYFSKDYGNPSSIHKFGQNAEYAIESARRSIAELIKCSPGEVYFTSGGTESDNLALRGSAHQARKARGANHILISSVEHKAVSKTVEYLAKNEGFEVEYLPVDAYGRVDPNELKTHLREDTAIVSIIHGNNEIGTINDIASLGSECKQHGVPLHTDAVQTGAHVAIDVSQLNVDLLSLGAHKFYGPKGMGVLFIRDGTNIRANITGGDQEAGKRAGTENVPSIVGLSRAFELAQTGWQEHEERLSILRDRIIEFSTTNIADVFLSGDPTNRLSNHASFVIAGLESNTLLMILDALGYACSSSSACKTGSPEPSEVLTSIGFSTELASGSLRVTVGNGTTEEHVNGFIDVLPKSIAKARKVFA